MGLLSWFKKRKNKKRKSKDSCKPSDEEIDHGVEK